MLGATLITAGLIGVTFGIVRTDTLGWGSPGVLVPLAAGLLLLARVPARRGARGRVAAGAPVDLPLRQLRAANAVVLLIYAAIFPVWFFLTLYLQQVLHYDAIEAGLGFLPMTLSIFAGSTLAPRVVARFGARRVITPGCGRWRPGCCCSPASPRAAATWAACWPVRVLTALGMGFSLVPSTIVAMQAWPGRRAALASGLLNTSRLMGGALGLAILSTIASAQTRATPARARPRAHQRVRPGVRGGARPGAGRGGGGRGGAAAAAGAGRRWPTPERAAPRRLSRGRRGRRWPRDPGPRLTLV